MKVVTPPAPLNTWVGAIWLQPADAASAPAELALPTGTVELVVNLDDDRIHVAGADDLTRVRRFTGPVICGPHSRPFALTGGPRARTLGVHFLPGGASLLLPVPLHELENRHVPLEDLIGAPAVRLREALERVRTDDDALVRIIVDFLTCFLCPTRFHPAVRWAIGMLGGDGGMDVRSLVDGSGLSHRRFNELFRLTVGLGAKRYSGIVRFQRAIVELEHRTDWDWAALAASCGFYDQAHLIHAFHRHAGSTPSVYLERRGERLNHPIAPAEQLTPEHAP